MDNGANLNRISLMGIPVDIVTQENMSTVLDVLLTNGKHNQIVFMSYQDFLKAKFNKNYRYCLKTAALVIPTSKILARAAHFLKKPELSVYAPFSFIIKMLSSLETKNSSLYLLGANKKNLQNIEKNLRISFPGIHFVGRFVGKYSSDMEKNIMSAITKASPTVLLAGRYVKGNEYWITRRKELLNPGISLWSKESMDIFSGRRKKKVNNRVVKKMSGFKILLFPFYILQTIFYLLILSYYKIKKT